jgi:uncharacterized protein YjbI with pentapeptide repeats
VFLEVAYLCKADIKYADLYGAYLGEADLGEADLGEADLRGADLHGANLSGAHLASAHLTGAMLRNANLSGAYIEMADLSKADLYRANLHGANLRRANLREAILSEAILIRADLTEAILSGACLDNANLAEWVIQDVTCDHIIQIKSRQTRRIPFGPQEFEKKYTQVAMIAELVLSIALTESTGFVANAIAQSINHVRESPVMLWKGAEALSDRDTRITFNVFDADFFVKQKETFETVFRVALNDYFRDLQAHDVSDSYLDPVEIMTGGLLKIKKLIPIKFTPLEINSKELEKRALAFFVRTGKMGIDILNIATSIFR